MYVMTTTTLEREGGLERLRQANELIQEAIESSKGTFKIKMEVGFCRLEAFNCMRLILETFVH